MSLKAGRVGVNPADVDPIDGHISPSSLEVYTKEEADTKFLSKENAVSDYQTKTLSVPIELLVGSALTVESALQGINSEVNDIDDAVDDISDRVVDTPYSYIIRHNVIANAKTYLLEFDNDYPICFFATTNLAQACTVTTKSGTATEPFVVPLNFTGTNEIFNTAIQLSHRSFKITINGYRNTFIISDTKCVITEVVEP